MCRVTSKAVIVILTFVFWALAAGLITIGSYVMATYGHLDKFTEAQYTLIPAVILMGIGCLVIIVGIIGCAGALKDNKCLLATFCTILLLIVLCTLLAGVLGYVYRGKVKKGLKDGIKEGMRKYGAKNETSWTNQIDYMQRELHCCGLHNYTDWADTPWGRDHNETIPVPASCGNHTQTGCYDTLKSFFLQNLAIIAGTAGGFVLIVILGMISSCVLVCKRKNREVPYVGLTNPGSGLRV